MTTIWRFKTSLLVTIGALSLIILLINLGLWQWQRAAVKQALLDSYAKQRLNPQTIWHTEDILPQPYSHVKLIGHYLPITLFLDNQYYQHQSGYDIIVPFQLSNGKIILVDRGFLAHTTTRKNLPTLPLKNHIHTISGYAYYPSNKQFTLGQPYEIYSRDKIIIERINFTDIQNILHYTIYPFIIRQNTSHKNGLIRDWAIVSMPPARHHAYAVQWFAMAVSVLLLYIWLVLRVKT